MRPPGVERLLILRGRSTGYGRDENAVKVLFALDRPPREAALISQVSARIAW